MVGVVRQHRGGAAPAMVMVAEALLPPLIRPLGRAVSASIRKRDSVISSSGSRGRHRGGRGSDGLAVREALPEKLASAGMGVDDGTGIALLLLFLSMHVGAPRGQVSAAEARGHSDGKG